MKSPLTHAAAIGVALAMLFTFLLPGGNGVLPKT